MSDSLDLEEKKRKVCLLKSEFTWGECVIGDPIDFPSSFQSCCNDFILVAGGGGFFNIVAERNNQS